MAESHASFRLYSPQSSKSGLSRHASINIDDLSNIPGPDKASARGPDPDAFNSDLYLTFKQKTHIITEYNQASILNSSRYPISFYSSAIACLGLAKRFVKWMSLGASEACVSKKRMEDLLASAGLSTDQPFMASDSNVITAHDIAGFLFSVFSERDRLASSFNSMDGLIKTVNRALSILFLMFIIIVFLLVFVNHNIVNAICAFLLGAAYYTKSFGEQMVESAFFILVIDPFSIGDRVFFQIDGITKNLVVDKIHILGTSFTQLDGQSLYFPNNVLAKMVIININRSGGLYDYHELEISFSTPLEKIMEFRKNILAWVAENTAHFYPNCFVLAESTGSINGIKLSVCVQHRTNWQDHVLRKKRTSQTLMYIVSLLGSLGITYVPVAQRINLLNIPKI